MRQSFRAALVSLSITGTACHPWVSKISGPSESKEGVKVQILGIECEAVLEDPESGRDIELTMDVAVTNDSSASLHFYPDRLRLLGTQADGPTETGANLAIAKGQRRVETVRFVDPSLASCGSPMKLDFADSLALGEPVRVMPIGFVAASPP